MQKHNNARKTSGHRSLEKYVSHSIERVVCERELETEQNCNILTSTLMAITAFFSRSPGCSTGVWGPSLCGTWSSFQHLLSNFKRTSTQQRAGCWFSLPHFISNWLELPVHRVILLFYAHSIQPVDSQGYPLVTFDRIHLLFTQVHFLFWLLGRGQYATYILNS